MFPSLSKFCISNILYPELKAEFGNKFCFVIESKRWQLYLCK